MRRPRPSLSVVIPLFNESQCIPHLLHRLERVLGDLEVSAELVLVDDASTDGSFALLRQTRPTLFSLKALRLAENVGSQQALLCGMSVANGDAVVNMDADLQHPPEELPRMLAAWQSGYDIVEMYRTGAESLDPLRTLGTRLFYALHRFTSPTPAAPSSSDFRLLDRQCVSQLTQPPRPSEFLRATVRRLRGTRLELAFEPRARFAGSSGYSLHKLARYALQVLVRRPPPPYRVVEIHETSPEAQ